MSEVSQDHTKKTFGGRMKELPPVFVTVLVFVLGLVTGWVGNVYNVQLQNQRYILELRQSAYSNYFEGQAKLQQSRQLRGAGLTDEADKLQTESNLTINQALFQIAIFSTKPVNEALAEYFRTRFPDEYDPCPGDRQAWLNDAKIYQTMRQEVFGPGSTEIVDDETLLILLFGCTLPSE